MSACEKCVRLGSCDSCTTSVDKGTLKGWECPVCGVGVSPYVTSCPCVTPPIFVCDPQYMPVYAHTGDEFPQRYIVTCGDQADKAYGKSSCGL